MAKAVFKNLFFILGFLSVIGIGLSYSSHCLVTQYVFADNIDNNTAQTVALTVTENDSGISKNLKKGDLVQIELMAHGSAGYLWHFDESYKNKFDLIHENTLVQDQPGLVGAPVKMIWIFKAREIGEANLGASLYRPWEGKEKTIRQFNVTLDIN